MQASAPRAWETRVDITLATIVNVVMQQILTMMLLRFIASDTLQRICREHHDALFPVSLASVRGAVNPELIALNRQFTRAWYGEAWPATRILIMA